MSNGFPTVAQPILIVDDVASEAMTLDLLCQSPVKPPPRNFH
jgi:hypothetical protein